MDFSIIHTWNLKDFRQTSLNGWYSVLSSNQRTFQSTFLAFVYFYRHMAWSIAHIFLYPNCFWKCQFVMMSTEIRISRLIVYFLCFVNNHWCQSFCWALTAIQIGIFKNNSGTKVCGQLIKPFGDGNKQRPKK